jgi:hypothetical protein
MIESPAPLKRIEFVAFAAISGEPGEGVTRIPGVVKVRTVTAIARRRGPGVLVVRSPGMAILAVERSMHAEKWKSCRLVSLDHVGDFPRLEGVASNAIRSKLRFVDVNVARTAELSGYLERKIFVAAYACCSLVSSFESKSGCGVVEQHIRSHLPRISCVTLLAWDRKRSVRRGLGIARAQADKHQKSCNEQSGVHFTP